MSDVIIVGSGPAGISASLYTARAGFSTTVISMGTGALGKAEAIENYYGFAQPVSGEELARAGIEGAKNVGVQFVSGEVVGINYDDQFVIVTTGGTYKAQQVLLATGTARTAPRIPGLKEFEGRGVSYCAVCDAFFYRGKQVVVLGSGEYAVHEIAALLPVAASVTLLTNGADVTVPVPEQVKIDKRSIVSIDGGERVEKVSFSDGGSLAADGVFIAYGVAGSTALARKIGAQIDGNKIEVDENMSTTIPGLYAAGDCTGGLLQVSKAVYEGAKAGTEIVRQAHKNK
ncbi:MAG: NAD(P)/FAD-dependent oxidoreductase [Clostridiales bacterium]|nr:NAD(P)/FAD-dependent oxidoreductase [Clostridiales bacterium]